jgi:hypothetical protein
VPESEIGCNIMFKICIASGNCVGTILHYSYCLLAMAVFSTLLVLSTSVLFNFIAMPTLMIFQPALYFSLHCIICNFSDGTPGSQPSVQPFQNNTILPPF